MDRHVLGFLGSEPDEFAKAVAELGTDDRIASWAQARLAGRSASDINRFNADFAEDAPSPDSEGEKFHHSERERLGRPDITSWFDLLDLDEAREVPRRIAA